MYRILLIEDDSPLGKAADLLSLKIEAKSAPGSGSAISIVFPEESVSR